MCSLHLIILISEDIELLPIVRKRVLLIASTKLHSLEQTSFMFSCSENAQTAYIETRAYSIKERILGINLAMIFNLMTEVGHEASRREPGQAWTTKLIV
jgi:hypothetical protein